MSFTIINVLNTFFFIFSIYLYIYLQYNEIPYLIPLKLIVIKNNNIFIVSHIRNPFFSNFDLY